MGRASQQRNAENRAVASSFKVCTQDQKKQKNKTKQNKTKRLESPLSKRCAEVKSSVFYNVHRCKKESILVLTVIERNSLKNNEVKSWKREIK